MNAISRRTAAVLVFAFVVLALGLRLGSLDAGLPCFLESDGSVIQDQVELLRIEGASRDSITVWQLYPHLIAEIAALIPAHVRAGDTLEDHLAAAAAPYLQIRLVVALLSLLAIPATYWLARAFLARGPALLATLLCATSLLTLVFAHQARPHAPAAALSTLAVVAALRLARRPDWLNCSLAGIVLGLSIGVLQSGVACALPVAAAWFWRDRGRPGGASRWIAPLWISCLAGGIVYALYPHAMPSVPGAPDASGFAGLVFTTGASQQHGSQAVGHDIFLGEFNGSGFLTVARTLISFEPMILLAALVGLALGSRSLLRRQPDAKARRNLIVACAYALPYLVVIGLYARTYERFCLQLIPFIACLAAAAWDRISRHGTRSLAIVCLLVIALPALLASLSLERMRRGRSSPEQLGEWIRANVARDAERVLFLPGVDVPLARTESAIGNDAAAPWNTPWTMYQRRHLQDRWDGARYSLGHSPLLRIEDCVSAMKDPIAAVRASGASLVALPMPSDNAPKTFTTELAASFRAALVREATLACRLPARAGDSPQDRLLLYDNMANNTNWTWELICGSPSLQSTLEVHRMP